MIEAILVSFCNVYMVRTCFFINIIGKAYSMDSQEGVDVMRGIKPVYRDKEFFNFIAPKCKSDACSSMLMLLHLLIHPELRFPLEEKFLYKESLLLISAMEVSVGDKVSIVNSSVRAASIVSNARLRTALLALRATRVKSVTVSSDSTEYCGEGSYKGDESSLTYPQEDCKPAERIFSKEYLSCNSGRAVSQANLVSAASNLRRVKRDGDCSLEKNSGSGNDYKEYLSCNSGRAVSQVNLFSAASNLRRVKRDGDCLSEKNSGSVNYYLVSDLSNLKLVPKKESTYG